MMGTVQSDGLSDAPMNLPPIRPDSARARDRASGSLACFAAFIFCLSRARSAFACPRNFWLLQYFRTSTIARPEITETIEMETIGEKFSVQPSSQSHGT